MLDAAPQVEFTWKPQNSQPADEGMERRERRPPHLRLVERPRELPDVLRARDAAMIRHIFPYIAMTADHYYRAEVQGIENLTDKAALMVSTHNGSIATPDLYCLFVSFLRRFGLETPAYGLAHKAVFELPGFAHLFPKFGAIPASKGNGQTVLEAGYPLLVCPGGDIDALKPYSKRHEVQFGKRRGFIKLALEQQVPIIPIVSVGAHEVMMIINDGEKTAKWLKLDRLLRIKSVPLAFSFPFGFTIAGLGSLPLPSKIKVRVLPPITFDEKPGAENDPAAVERCFEHVRSEMQLALTDLASQRKRPIFG